MIPHLRTWLKSLFGASQEGGSPEIAPRALFTAPVRNVSRVFIHCSDSPHKAHDNISVIRLWHVNERGFSDVGYHYFIKFDGTIQSGRNIEAIPAAQAGHNAHTIAICLAGRDVFTEEQFDALRALCETIHREIPKATFHGHREVSTGKTCPNFDVKTVLGLDAKGVMQH